MLEMRSRSFLLAIFSVVCKLFVAVEQPTITLEEGLPAKIPCMVKGFADAYFWRRGENLTISDEIATIVFGVPGVVSDAFRVTEDGTLMIYNVTSAIEGRYFCRISTKDNAYFSDVMVLVQALCDDFGFGIEQCYPKENCTLQVEPSKETKLTCTAKGGPSSLSLKWFNGSKEINSVSNEHPLNEESSTVSETITVPNEFGLPLTCEAVASEDGQACARLAHVRLDKTDTAKEQTDADKSSALWIIVLVLLVLLVVETVLTVFLLKYIHARNEKYAQKKKRTSEQEGLLVEKDGERKDLQVHLEQTIQELRDLQDKFQQKNFELTDLQEKFQKANDELYKVKKGLVAKNATLMQKNFELTDLQEKFQKANDELYKVKKGLVAKTATLMRANDELDKVKKSLAAKNTTLTGDAE